MEQVSKLYISASVADDLPSMVKNGFAKMPAQKQEEFVEEYKRKAKSLGTAYLFLINVLAMHLILKSKQMTRKIIFGILSSVFLIMTSCTNALDKYLNKEDFGKVKETIQADNNYSPMKKKYIMDNLNMQMGLAELGKTMNMDESKIPTFREQINELTTDFDSIRTAKLKIIENNNKLENFLTLKDANTVSIDKYKGYLSMTLKFKNQFEKEILYIIFNYKYVNKYDSEFFSEKSKLTDEIAKNFNSEVEISTNEEYNNVADFMYTKVPVKANKELRDELGDEVANEKIKKKFLMEGLKVFALGIMFKDKTELVYQDADWKYFEE